MGCRGGNRVVGYDRRWDHLSVDEAHHVRVKIVRLSGRRARAHDCRSAPVYLLKVCPGVEVEGPVINCQLEIAGTDAAGAVDQAVVRDGTRGLGGDVAHVQLPASDPVVRGVSATERESEFWGGRPREGVRVRTCGNERGEGEVERDKMRAQALGAICKPREERGGACATRVL